MNTGNGKKSVGEKNAEKSALMRNFIKRELGRDNREKIDYRIFNRKTKTFYENSPDMMLTLSGDAVLQINGVFVPSDEIVVQRYVGARDRNGKKIYEGDFLQTNEGNWRGFVVFFDGFFGVKDYEGWYSAEPEWEECEVLANICEMDANPKYLGN